MATGTETSVDVLKRVIFGRALASHKAEHQLLPKILALPVFSSDPLSSVAYATEEMMLVLVLAGAGALTLKLPLAVGVATLLLIVVTSYRQTVRAYPMGGGSYIVARENLGTGAGLTAAAAILTDYVLTVAVSVTAGTVAIVSAVPSLETHKVLIAVGLVGFVTLANLRGVREAGVLFAIPTYGFVAIVAVTIVIGFARCLGGCPVAATAVLEIEAEVGGLTTFLVLRAFSSGATALTGVEAIADGVQAFRRPQSKNAAATLAIMGGLAISLFLGITALATLFHVRITEEIAATNSVLSQIGRTLYGDGFLFYVLQVFTAGILVLAANTAFQDFPRLSSILARDGFMPSQFKNLGDRLVFSNGVVILAGLACLLIWIYDAHLSRLIQLYVVGVFTAFTLSQTGMVRRWFRVKGARWWRSALINGIGALTTGVVLVIVTITKFDKGAKVVVFAIPVIVLNFLLVRRHYGRVGAILRRLEPTGVIESANSFLVLVNDLGPATRDAVAYLRAVRPFGLVALWTGPPDGFEEAVSGWRDIAPRLGELISLSGGHTIRGVRAAVRAARTEQGGFVTVVVPEQIRGGFLRYLIDRRASVLLKAILLFEPGAVVTDVPSLPGRIRRPHQGRPVEPSRSVVLVPVSAVHDATVRAVIYARSLGASHVEALWMMTDAREQASMVKAWQDRGLDVPLVMVEAPFRDLGDPLVREVRAYTSRVDTVVTVVLPELVPAHWWQNVLHNQTALFVKRLLLFEPGVVLTSVPFHLAHPEIAVVPAAPP
jgi:amino acid transporter